MASDFVENFAKELQLIACVAGLYGSFIYWGYLQEKLTSNKYIDQNGNTLHFSYPFALNFIVAIAAVVLSSFVNQFDGNKIKLRNLNLLMFWKAGLTLALASPVGYASLRYITFPLMVLTKSSKPIPVMMIGLLFYKRSFPLYKYVSVILVCGGITLFSASRKASRSEPPSPNILLGIALVFVNLLLDGYTNNEQDEIFKRHKMSFLDMMTYTNLFQVLFLLVCLLFFWCLNGDSSELIGASRAIYSSADIRYDMLCFCLCSCVGQILIFKVMQEFGSLVWITISITRKLFTILLSVFIFHHSVAPLQWCGIGLVFLGLAVESAMPYFQRKDIITDDIADGKIKTE